MAASLAAAVVLMRTLPSGAGLFAALGLVLAVAAFCFWPLDGRSAEEWLPIVSRARTRRVARAAPAALGRPCRGRSRRTTAGRPEPVVALPEAAQRPRAARSAVPRRDGRRRERRAREDLHRDPRGARDVVRPPRPLRAGGEAGRLGRRARKPRPRGNAREPRPVGRADGARRRRRDRPLPRRGMGPRARRRSTRCRCSPTSTSSAQRPAVTRDHELFVCLQIDAKRAWRQIKRAGGKNGPDAGASTVLLRELEGARRAARRGRRPGRRRASPGNARLRDPHRLRPVVAAGSRAARGGRPRAGRARRGRRLADGQRSVWAGYRTDGAVHATYWIAGWPRTDVGAAFLSPLLLHAQVVRSIAVTIEPISPLRAIREVEAARTTDLADQELRGRFGFVETARRRRLTGGDLAPRGGARRRPRRCSLRRLRHRVRAHSSRSSSATAPRSSTPRRWRGSSCCASTASRKRRSPTRCRSAGACDERQAASPGTATTTAHVQAAYPFVAEGGLGGRGVYIGRDVYGGSFCYDPWELYGRELTSPNAVVIGIVGRAKSSLVKTYVFRQSVFGRQAWIVDVKGEYDRLAEALGVQPIALSPGGSIRLNPLTPRGGAERQLNLLYSRRRGRARAAAHAGGEARRRRRRCTCSSVARDSRADAARRRRRAHAPDRRDGRRARDATPTSSRTAVRPMAFALDQLCSGNLRGHVRRPHDAGPRPRRAARRAQPPRRPQHAHDRARDPDDLRHRLAPGA